MSQRRLVWPSVFAAVVLLVIVIPCATGAVLESGNCQLPRDAVQSQRGLQPGPWSVPLKKSAPSRLECALNRLEDASRERGLEAALAFAGLHGLETDGHMVMVTVRPVHGETTGALDLEAIRELGGVERARSTHFLDVSIPFDRLAELSECEGVGYVQRLMRGVPTEAESTLGDRTVVSEGVALTGADIQHAAGYYGTGMKVAVIDMGFVNATNSQAHGELPALYYHYDWTGTGLETTTEHGTAVAENVHEMAPGAELYLIKVATAADLENAKDQVVAAGINIVNYSVGWFGQPGDGTGDICDIVEDAYANGILWVNSAGNNADNHNEGTFTDTDWDGWHEFAPGDEFLTVLLSAGFTFKLHLTWDGWPTTTEDYDLYLYNSSWTLVDFSDNNQSGLGLPPSEFIHYTVPTSGTYHVGIYDYYTTSAHEYDLMTQQWSLLQFGEYCVKSGSLLSPADAPHAFAVGAIHRDDWFAGPIAWFSSQGPTNDGRTKPEITGPDSCSSFTYTPNWIGTSSASPHVAGAAALIWSEVPAVITVDDVWNWLTDNAVDMGAAGQDNVYGYGRLNIPPDTPVEETIYAVLTESNTALIRWSVASLHGVQSFNIYRARSSEGPFVEINEGPVEAVSPGNYEDTTVWPGVTFWYEVRAKHSDGSEQVVGYSNPSVFIPGRLAARLYDSSPNPMTDATSIRYQVPSNAGEVSIAVYDIRGRLVKSLIESAVLEGRQSVPWDGRDGRGIRVGSGVYFVRLDIGGVSQTRKLLVLR